MGSILVPVIEVKMSSSSNSPEVTKLAMVLGTRPVIRTQVTPTSQSPGVVHSALTVDTKIYQNEHRQQQGSNKGSPLRTTPLSPTSLLFVYVFIIYRSLSKGKDLVCF